MYPTNAQSKQQLVLHADTKFNYKVNNLIENMKYVLYDANIEFNAEKRAHVKCNDSVDVSDSIGNQWRYSFLDVHFTRKKKNEQTHHTSGWRWNIYKTVKQQR